jgi:hypothetical protein
MADAALQHHVVEQAGGDLHEHEEAHFPTRVNFGLLPRRAGVINRA